MVLEGRQKALWDLFEHYVSSKTRDADILFYQLSRALARYVSLESAYESIAKADSILKAHGFSERVRERFLRKTVSSLARATIGMDTTTVPASIFNYFIQKLQNSNLSPVYSYRLQLKHPSGPITAPALEYLQALNTSENAVSDESFANESIWFALDLAQALLKEDKQADARWVMSFLEKHHSKSLGLENQFTAAANKLKQTQQEASNLELLNNLDLGLS